MHTLGVVMLLVVYLGMVVPAIMDMYWPNWRLEDQQRREDWAIAERLKQEGHEPESEEEVRKRSEQRQAKLREYWSTKRKNDLKSWTPIAEMYSHLEEVTLTMKESRQALRERCAVERCKERHD